MYLISTSKKHYTVAHLLAPDGQHALCTAKPGEKTWPYAGAQFVGGKWMISEDVGDRLVCSACKRKANPKRPQPVATRAERKRAEELERLRKWNEDAKLVLDTESKK
jgi:hypothetical protein